MAKKSGQTANAPQSHENEILYLRERKRTAFFGLPFSFTKYTLTSKKLEVKTGFFSSTEDEILLYRIMDVTYSRSLGQKLFKLGSIKVKSTDKTLPDLLIKNIKHSKSFKNVLTDQIEKERLRLRFRTGEFMDHADHDCDHGVEDF